jgi:hypothetical protein
MISVIINELAHDRIKTLTVKLADEYFDSHKIKDTDSRRPDVETFIEQSIVQTVVKAVLDERFGFKNIIVERDHWLESFIKTQTPHIKRGVYGELANWS